MAPRFSIWIVLAGVAVGVVAGYLAGSGVIGKSPVPRRNVLREVRAELVKVTGTAERDRVLRAFDQAAGRVKGRRH